MNKKYLYSTYQINKAEKMKVKKDYENRCWDVEGHKLQITYGKFVCDCKFYTDGKTQFKFCSHILALIRHLDKESYRKVIKQDKK